MISTSARCAFVALIVRVFGETSGRQLFFDFPLICNLGDPEQCCICGGSSSLKKLRGTASARACDCTSSGVHGVGSRNFSKVPNEGSGDGSPPVWSRGKAPVEDLEDKVP